MGLLLVSLFNFFQESPTSPDAREINFSQFVAEVEAGNVEEVVISGDSITGRLADGRRFSQKDPSQPKGTPRWPLWNPKTIQDELTSPQSEREKAQMPQDRP